MAVGALTASVTNQRGIRDAPGYDAVMDERQDRDAGTAARIADARERSRFYQAVPEAAPPRSPAAERARRYRARKRGEDVPLRKPGPEPRSAEALAHQVRDLEAQLRETRAALKDAQAVPSTRRIRRGLIADAAKELLARLDANSAANDGPVVRELLRDVLATIDMRHDEWPEP